MNGAADERQGTPGRLPHVALYVHVPFCRARCAYCDFDTYAGIEDLIPAYVTAVRREMARAGERWGKVIVPTIYVGGGTPSLLQPDQMDGILRAARSAFHVPTGAEVTLEANPGTVTPNYLRDLHALGIHRLSLGVQSAQDDELRRLDRLHTWAQAVEAVSSAREAGFQNLSLDLIFGLPLQTLDRWRETLQAVLALEPEHLSLYGLTVEAGTRLERSIACGDLPAPDEDLAAEMYELAEDLLAEAGFFHYEISNWARTNDKRRMANSKSRMSDREAWWPDGATNSEAVSPYVCRHNLNYWRNTAWLGVGAAAHSWLKGRRWANVRHPRRYIALLDGNAPPVAEMEEIDRRLEMGETMMMGLRLAEGVSEPQFHARFDATLEETYGHEMAQLRDTGLLDWDGNAARLTARGRLLGNQVFAAFL